MSDRDPLAIVERIGVIDLGSNSLRLVVFERFGAALFPLFNEKVMCGLGRGIASTGRLNPDGIEPALVNLRRFVALARAIGVDHLAVMATAAVRDASDGEAFAGEVERQCRVRVDIIDGPEEARLSGAGVLAGIPDADGIAVDLGGGSVELVRVFSPTQPLLSGEAEQISGGISLPLGPFRLDGPSDNAKALSHSLGEVRNLAFRWKLEHLQVTPFQIVSPLWIEGTCEANQLLYRHVGVQLLILGDEADAAADFDGAVGNRRRGYQRRGHRRYRIATGPSGF